MLKLTIKRMRANDELKEEKDVKFKQALDGAEGEIAGEEEC
jgi:hypothetical protein